MEVWTRDDGRFYTVEIGAVPTVKPGRHRRAAQTKKPAHTTQPLPARWCAKAWLCGFVGCEQVDLRLPHCLGRLPQQQVSHDVHRERSPHEPALDHDLTVRDLFSADLAVLLELQQHPENAIRRDAGSL